MSEPQGIPQDLIDKARETIAADEEATRRKQEALDAKYAAVEAVERDRPEHVSQNEAARLLGLEPSTYRSMTADARRARRRT